LSTKDDQTEVNLNCRRTEQSVTRKVMKPNLDRPTRMRDLATPPLVLGDWRKHRRHDFLWLVITMVVAMGAAFSAVLWLPK
jgi:hypothetical protein